MMSRFHYASESDWSIMPYSIRAINGMTLFLPPEAICYYHNHIAYAHQTADIDTLLKVTLFVVPVFVGFGAQSADRNTIYFEKVKKYMNLAKSFCRPIIANNPVVYHHTPYIGVLETAEWCVLEYATKDRSKGYVGVFRLGSEGNEDIYLLRLQGVDPAKKYKITLDSKGFEYRAAGEKLMNEGINICLENINTSELVMYMQI